VATRRRRPALGAHRARQAAAVFRRHEAIAVAVDHQDRAAGQLACGIERAHGAQIHAGEQPSDPQRTGQKEAGQPRQLAVLPLDHAAEVGERAVGHDREDAGLHRGRQQRRRCPHRCAGHADARMASDAQYTTPRRREAPGDREADGGIAGCERGQCDRDEGCGCLHGVASVA
jgi:hypothetical protein